MGIVKRAGDLVYTLRFLRLLTTDFVDTKAFKLGLIDQNGKRNKDVNASSQEQRDAYTPFHRLVFNIKRIISKVPGAEGKLGSYAAALYLMKEQFSITENQMKEGITKLGGVVTINLDESRDWFVLEDGRLSPGKYKVANDKVLNSTCEELVKAKDWISISNDCYPVGSIFGFNVYEAVHVKTNQKVYVTVSELLI